MTRFSDASRLTSSTAARLVLLPALVLTDTRVAGLRGSESGVSEVDSIAIADIERMDASLSRRGASVVLHGKGTELAVHRAPAPQVHALFEALRQAGVQAEG